MVARNSTKISLQTSRRILYTRYRILYTCSNDKNKMCAILCLVITRISKQTDLRQKKRSFASNKQTFPSFLSLLSTTFRYVVSSRTLLLSPQPCRRCSLLLPGWLVRHGTSLRLRLNKSCSLLLPSRFSLHETSVRV